MRKARDTTNGQRVAMKRAEVFSDPHDPNDQGVPVGYQTCGRLNLTVRQVTVLREGALLRRLNHPNIVQVDATSLRSYLFLIHVCQLHEIFMHDNHCYFVFELCSCNLR